RSLYSCTTRRSSDLTIISAQWHRDDEENIAINVFGLSHFCVSRAKLPQVDGVFFSVRSSSHIFSLPLISPSNSRKRLRLVSLVVIDSMERLIEGIYNMECHFFMRIMFMFILLNDFLLYVLVLFF